MAVMVENPRKELVRHALAEAQQRMPATEIGREISVSGGSLRNFLSSGYLGRASLDKLERWLLAKGFLDATALEEAPNHAREAPSPYSPAMLDNLTPAKLLSKQLRLLADLVESPNIAPEDKVLEFTVAIRAINDRLDNIAKRLNPPLKGPHQHD